MLDATAANRFERNTFDSRNPMARFAHRTRLKRSLALAAAALPLGGTLVDFGAGSGRLLHALKSARSDATFIGIETLMTSDDLDYRQALSDVAPGSVDVVTCFEVCEHLADDELAALFDDACKAMTAAGRLIVSVPVMVGLSVPLKAANQKLFGRGTEWTLSDVLRATVGLRVERPEGRRWSHRGFDFRELVGQLSRRFCIQRVSTSPVVILPWWLSSQVFIEGGKR